MQVAYTTMVDAFDSLCLTKLDVLTGLETIKVGRKYLLDGKELPSMPAEAEDLARVEVVYDELPGWSEDISKWVRERCVSVVCGPSRSCQRTRGSTWSTSRRCWACRSTSSAWVREETP